MYDLARTDVISQIFLLEVIVGALVRAGGYPLETGVTRGLAAPDSGGRT